MTSKYTSCNTNKNCFDESWGLNLICMGSRWMACVIKTDCLVNRLTEKLSDAKWKKLSSWAQRRDLILTRSRSVRGMVQAAFHLLVFNHELWKLVDSSALLYFLLEGRDNGEVTACYARYRNLMWCCIHLWSRRTALIWLYLKCSHGLS